MKIAMLEDRRGSEDGHTVLHFLNGKTYHVAHTLACRFIVQGAAIEVQPDTLQGEL